MSFISAFSWCPRTYYCCCKGCCSVRTGSILISCLFIIFGFFWAADLLLEAEVTYYLVCIDLAINALLVITGFFLLTGTLSDSHCLQKISLCLILVLIASYVVLSIISIGESQSNDDVEIFGPKSILTKSLITIGVLIYFFIVVLSYHSGEYRESIEM